MFRVGLGEYAALGTAFTWGVSSHVHSVVSRIIGPNALVLLRTPYQLFFLLLLCLVLERTPLFDMLTLSGVLRIFLSGFFGLILADMLLYRGIVLIGPQMGILLQSTSSIFTALLGFLFLRETLSLQALAGILIVSLGVAGVLAGRNANSMLPGQEPPKGRVLVIGVAMGLGSAFFLACGFITVKSVLREGFSPLWAAVIRVAFAMITLWCVGFFKGWSQEAIRGVRENHRVFWMLLGSNTFGALGIWLSNVALDLAPSGIAASLMGLQPVMVTIIGMVLYRKLPSALVIIGTLIAFGGTALVCLR